MDRRIVHTVVRLALAAVALTGCGRQPGLVPVEGVLTLDGKPVGGATVFLVSDGGSARTATATTLDDGAFRLATYNADGVAPGNYRAIVTVVMKPAPEASSATESSTGARERAAWQRARNLKVSGQLVIPPIYTDSSTTPLRCTIPVDGKLQLELHSTGR